MKNPELTATPVDNRGALAFKWTEDWLALVIGLLLFLVAALALAGFEPFGWVAKTNVWLDPAKIITPISAKLSALPAVVSLVLTFLACATVLGIGAVLLGSRLARFLEGFTFIFFASYLCFAAGHFAYIAVTADQLKKWGISWSLNLTGEAGLIIALLAGLAVGNFLPRLAAWLKEAVRPEWCIKIAIVLLGAGLGVKSAKALGLASVVMFRGLCAIIEACLIYWALVYFVARKYFGISREWAAPLASGISIGPPGCGLRLLPFRFHTMDWPRHLLVILPRSQT